MALGETRQHVLTLDSGIRLDNRFDGLAGREPRENRNPFTSCVG
jgi:hypothetical protein